LSLFQQRPNVSRKSAFPRDETSRPSPPPPHHRDLRPSLKLEDFIDNDMACGLGDLGIVAGEPDMKCRAAGVHRGDCRLVEIIAMRRDANPCAASASINRVENRRMNSSWC
jgi:hypothetical protein